MNRDQAIAASKNLRKGKTVARFVPEDKDKGEPAFWEHKTFDSISAAKRRMRELGRGVALVGAEKLPSQKEAA